MIQLIRPALSINAAQSLEQYQTAVDNQPDFPTKVNFAKDDFPKKNIIGNATFNDVKLKLIQMSSGAERCHYCEDSKADEVDHLLPKDAYPNHCYSWNNYYYACGTCNGPKNNKCAVIDATTNTLVDTTPPRKSKNGPPLPPPQPPLAGISAFVDPVNENPLDYFFLDLNTGTFVFSELPANNTSEYQKAKYTLEVFRLNTRPSLSKARGSAYVNFKARLRIYIIDRDSGVVTQHQLNEIIRGIKEEAHQTVWQEMKRQKDFIPELHDLFHQAPEALNW